MGKNSAQMTIENKSDNAVTTFTAVLMHIMKNIMGISNYVA